VLTCCRTLVDVESRGLSAVSLTFDLFLKEPWNLAAQRQYVRDASVRRPTSLCLTDRHYSRRIAAAKHATSDCH
jgi:hypothetical protein